MFVGDFNAHHIEWLNLVTPTDIYDIAAQDFSTISCCEQLLGEPTRQSSINPLDLVFADCTWIVFCGVSSPVGSSHHNLIKIDVEMDQMYLMLAFQGKFTSSPVPTGMVFFKTLWT